MRFLMKVREGHILEMPVIIQFENLTSCLLSKMPKICVYETIFPFLHMDVKSGSLVYGKNINWKFLEARLGKYLDL